MIADGDGCATFTTTDQSLPLSENVSPDESKLLSDPQPELSTHLVDIPKDVADVVDDVISRVIADDGNSCTTVKSVAPSTLECRSMHACSTSVPAASDIADDVELVEVLNGNCLIVCTHKIMW